MPTQVETTIYDTENKNFHEAWTRLFDFTDFSLNLALIGLKIPRLNVKGVNRTRTRPFLEINRDLWQVPIPIPGL